jgi:hypothetical protein
MIGDVMATLVKEKKEVKESKHYIPFNAAEWAKLEEQAGRKLEPKDLKALIGGIFDGTLKVSKA